MKSVKQLLVWVWNKAIDILIFLNDKYLIAKDSIVQKIVKPPQIVTLESTIELIIKNNMSVCRFGDGEFKLMNGKNISFQKYDVNLQGSLQHILKQNNDNLLVCIPDIFSKLEMYDDEPCKYWKLHVAKTRLNWYKLLKKDKVYGNAFISRCYYMYKDKGKSKSHFMMMQQIWNNRDVIIVEGEKSRLGIGNDLFDDAKSIDRILIPAENAFEFYDEILATVENQSKDKLVLLAAGPTATVLAYELSKAGYQAIDIGHIDIEYEWFLKKATKKEKVNNKYVCEAGMGEGVGECNDKTYLSQIICRVG